MIKRDENPYPGPNADIINALADLQESFEKQTDLVADKVQDGLTDLRLAVEEQTALIREGFQWLDAIVNGPKKEEPTDGNA